MTLPAVLLLLDVRPLRRLDPRPWRWARPEARPVLIEKVPYALLSLAVTALAFLAQARSTSLEETAGYAPAARLMVPAFGLVFPLWKTVLPIGLLPLYPRKAGLNPFEPRFLLAAAALVLLVALVAVLARRLPGLTVGALAYAVLLVPVLGFVQIGVQVAADRFSYLPSVALSVLLGLGAALVWNREGAARTVAGTSVRIAGISVLALFSLLSWRQCAAWKDAPTLWDHALAIAPEEPLFHNYRGLAAYRLRDYARAVEFLEQALAIDPRASMAHYPLGLAYRGLGDMARADAHLRQRGDVEVGPTDPLMQALAELLDSSAAWEKRGLRALDGRDWAAAAAAFGKATALAPENASLHHRLGTALSLSGDTRGAEQQFQEAIRRAPDFAPAHFSLGVLLASSGQTAQAAERFAAALRYEPGNAEARLQLAVALIRAGRYQEARGLLLEGARLHPDRPEFGRLLQQFRPR